MAENGARPSACSRPLRMSALQCAQHQARGRLRAERRRLAGHRDALAGQVAYDLLADRVHQDGRAAVVFGLADGGGGVVDVRDVLRGVRDAPDVVEERGVQDRRVEGAPGLRTVGGDRTGEEVRVRAVDEVEGAVAGEEEGVARGGRVGEGVQGLGEGAVDGAYAEGVRQGGQGRRRRGGGAGGGGSRGRGAGSGRCRPGGPGRSPRGWGRGAPRADADTSPSGGGRRR